MDIVDRAEALRNCLGPPESDMIGELTAEIERLKARLQPDPESPPVDQERDHLAEQCTTLLREIERLERIIVGSDEENKRLRADNDWLRKVLGDAIAGQDFDRARRALEQKSNTE
jgi:hypothetical protein